MKFISKLMTLSLIGIGLLLLFCCSSGRRDFTVKIIVPSDYSGLIRIRFIDGEYRPPVRNNEQVFLIPNSGVLRVGGSNPFLRLGVIEAEDAKGERILSAGQIFAQDEIPDPNEKLFRVVGGTNDGLEFWAVVGTEIEEQAARLLLHEYLNKLLWGQVIKKQGLNGA